MIALAISILWLAIGVIILLGVIWIAPAMDIASCGSFLWAIALILCLIGVLSLLAGGGGEMHFPRIN